MEDEGAGLLLLHRLPFIFLSSFAVFSSSPPNTITNASDPPPALLPGLFFDVLDLIGNMGVVAVVDEDEDKEKEVKDVEEEEEEGEGEENRKEEGGVMLPPFPRPPPPAMVRFDLFRITFLCCRRLLLGRRILPTSPPPPSCE